MGRLLEKSKKTIWRTEFIYGVIIFAIFALTLVYGANFYRMLGGRF